MHIVHCCSHGRHAPAEIDPSPGMLNRRDLCAARSKRVRGPVARVVHRLRPVRSPGVGMLNDARVLQE